MTLETSKNLGGIGAILMFIGVFPYINFYGVIDAGWPHTSTHCHERTSRLLQRSGIFNNALYAFILAIVGVVAFIAILFIACAH